MKMYKHGMVLGKFYPPHYGHFYLIEQARISCDFVTVFVCSLKSETISGHQRYKWVYDMYKHDDTVKVVHILKELPQHPEDHFFGVDDFYRLWINTIKKHLHGLDALFTSERYGDEFASYLNVPHILVDLNRETYPVSGTDIRTNPHKYWEFIPLHIKPYFKRKITIMGPESTGKTTLMKKLAEHFNGDMVLEYGREYTDEYPASTIDVEDFESIAEQHSDNIYDIIQHGYRPLVFIDTEAITTKLFGKMYLGDKFKSDYIEKIIDNQHDRFNLDLVLVCDIDVPWVDDGTRDFPNDRHKHLDLIKRELYSRGIQFYNISGTYEERFDLAKKIIEEKQDYVW